MLDRHLVSRITLLLLFLVVLAPFRPARGQGDQNVNLICPVQPNRRAVSKYKAVHAGKSVYFCCRTCTEEFESAPSEYLSLLPQFSDPSEEDAWESWLQKTALLMENAKQYRKDLILLSVVLIFLLVVRLRRNVSQGSTSFLFSRAGVFAVLILALFVDLILTRMDLKEVEATIEEAELEDRLHFATFYDYGFPPAPYRRRGLLS